MINNIVFDFGGVLMDWNPRYLYRDCFQTEEEMEWFLSTICTNEWNQQQDAGRSLAEGTRLLLEWYHRERPVYHPLAANHPTKNSPIIAAAHLSEPTTEDSAVAAAYLSEPTTEDSAVAAAYLSEPTTEASAVAPASAADTYAEAFDIEVNRRKDYSDLIKLYYGRWETMLHSDIPETAALVHELKQKGYPIFGLTNWSAETLPIAYARYSFFEDFDGIVASGEEFVAKPDAAIYNILLDRYHLIPQETLFIDDNQSNLDTAKQLGINTFLFNPERPEESCAEIKKVILGPVPTS